MHRLVQNHYWTVLEEKSRQKARHCVPAQQRRSSGLAFFFLFMSFPLIYKKTLMDPFSPLMYLIHCVQEAARAELALPWLSEYYIALDELICIAGGKNVDAIGTMSVLKGLCGWKEWEKS